MLHRATFDVCLNTFEPCFIVNFKISSDFYFGRRTFIVYYYFYLLSSWIFFSTLISIFGKSKWCASCFNRLKIEAKKTFYMWETETESYKDLKNNRNITLPWAFRDKVFHSTTRLKLNLEYCLLSVCFRIKVFSKVLDQLQRERCEFVFYCWVHLFLCASQVVLLTIITLSTRNISKTVGYRSVESCRQMDLHCGWSNLVDFQFICFWDDW